MRKKQINMQLGERRAKGGKKNDRGKGHWKSYFLLQEQQFSIKIKKP